MPNRFSRPVSRIFKTFPLRGLLTAIFLGWALFSAAQNPVKDSILRIINDPAANDSLRARAFFSICGHVSRDSAVYYENELEKLAANSGYLPARALADRQRGHRYYKANVLDSSDACFKRCLELAEKLQMHETIGKASYNSIFLYYKTGEDIKGVAAAQRAIRAFEITGDSLSLGNTYQQMGQCYQHLSQPAKSLEALQKALSIGEKINDATLLGNVYGTLGNLYYRQGDALKGIEYCKKGIELAEKTGFTYGIASGYGNLAGMYDFLKMETEADTADIRSLKAYEKLGDLNNIGIAKINMGYKLSRRGAHAEGLAMVKEGHELLKAKGSLWPLNVSMKMMGSVYAHQKKYDLSKK